MVRPALFLLSVFCWLACERAKTSRTDTLAAASSTPPQSASSTPSSEAEEIDEFARASTPDSSVFGWALLSSDIVGTESRFRASDVRRPSGLLVIWFDSATRATEEKPAGLTHVDSLIVRGLMHGELLAPQCNDAVGTRQGEVIGLVRDSSTFVQPRLAWKLDTTTFRIRAVPAGPYRCSAQMLFYDGEVDPD